MRARALKIDFIESNGPESSSPATMWIEEAGFPSCVSLQALILALIQKSNQQSQLDMQIVMNWLSEQVK